MLGGTSAKVARFPYVSVLGSDGSRVHSELLITVWMMLVVHWPPVSNLTTVATLL
jgi:hypothetical protein